MGKLTDQERDCKWLVWRDADNISRSFRYKKEALTLAKKWQAEGFHVHIQDQYPGQY